MTDCDATAHDLGELWSWRCASIPLVAALIGYVTNLLAIQMTFLPLEYIGGAKFFHRWGFSCGWQGIIPVEGGEDGAEGGAADHDKAIRVQDVFDQLEPAEIVKCVEPKPAHGERVLHEVASTHCPDVWETLPLVVRSEVARRLRALAAYRGDDARARGQIEEILDLEEFVVEKLTEDPELLSEIFKRCGEAEFQFIERSGLYFGFLLGLLQSLAKVRPHRELLPEEFFLPAAGQLCGYVNWIAVPHLQADRADTLLLLLHRRPLPPPPAEVSKGLRRSALGACSGAQLLGRILLTPTARP